MAVNTGEIPGRAVNVTNVASETFAGIGKGLFVCGLRLFEVKAAPRPGRGIVQL